MAIGMPRPVGKHRDIDRRKTCLLQALDNKRSEKSKETIGKNLSLCRNKSRFNSINPKFRELGNNILGSGGQRVSGTRKPGAATHSTPSTSPAAAGDVVISETTAATLPVQEHRLLCPGSCCGARPVGCLTTGSPSQ